MKAVAKEALPQAQTRLTGCNDAMPQTGNRPLGLHMKPSTASPQLPGGTASAASKSAKSPSCPRTKLKKLQTGFLPPRW